jgi:hypothetical protein
MSNLSSGFIDLATFDDVESFLYAGPTAVTYFIRQHKKSSWFAQVPVQLTANGGTPDFGQSWSVNISRAGDYLLHAWLEVVTPAITAGSTNTPLNFWCKNFMHNLIEECSITFNDLIAHKMDNVSLDFWAAFNVPAGKRDAYRKMIGAGTFSSDGQFVVGVSANVTQTFVLPLPFFFTRESGVALPTAAIPYNDMRINFKFRALADVLATYESATTFIPVASAVTTGYVVPSTKPVCKVYANYAIVSNDERQLMGSTPRDIVIEQNQSAPITSLTSETAAKAYDIRFSHAVKTLNFAIRNEKLYGATAQNSAAPGRAGYGGDFFSNYTRKSLAQEFAANTLINATQGAPYIRKSTIEKASLLYENTTRLSDMPSYYFTRVNPYYHQTTVPIEEGIHSYSYSLDSSSVDPMGSTNYGKLTNVSLSITPASGIVLATGGSGATDDLTPASCKVVICAVNHNVIRVSGGAVGFPVL